VFECSVSEMDYERLKHRLLSCIDAAEDNLRIYKLQSPKEEFIEHFGIKQPLDFEAPLVI
jgi:CRISPR-associated protein Cas2